MVGEKRKASSESGSAKKRQAISFETKVAIIKKLDAGEKMVSVARTYNLNRSTVGTIYKQKDRIMEHVKGAVAMQLTIISKKRGKIIEEMEKLLTIWLEDQQQRRIPLSLMLIQEKAKSIFEDVKAKAGESAAEEIFSASHGWFSRFKKRANLHHVSVSGEAASAENNEKEQDITLPKSMNSVPIGLPIPMERSQRSGEMANTFSSHENFPQRRLKPNPSQATASTKPENFKLRHKNHLTLVLESLAGDEAFMDVTLTAQGRAVKAHKSILSAVSPYFQSVLKENPCQHPIIIMPRDIRFDELNKIITYVYKGEVTVPSEDLPSLLKTAEVLQIDGLDATANEQNVHWSGAQQQHLPCETTFRAAPSSSFPKGADVSETQPPSHQSDSMSQGHEAAEYKDELLEAIHFETISPDITYVKEEILSDIEEYSPMPSDDTDPLDPSTCPLATSRRKFHKELLVPKRSTQDQLIRKPFPPGELNPDNNCSPVSPTSPHLSPDVCPHCLETHRPAKALQYHLRLKHPSKISLLCDCGRVFVRQQHLTKHQKQCKG